mmetsp:Transcript_24173/g.37907  ORF Transcript_24173/g.37907 Transcript_24173/m.37907 type:complete len:230 (+) Transcript_24173:164-853(+)
MSPEKRGTKLSKIIADTITAAAASASSGVTLSDTSAMREATITVILRMVSANTCVYAEHIFKFTLPSSVSSGSVPLSIQSSFKPAESSSSDTSPYSCSVSDCSVVLYPIKCFALAKQVTLNKSTTRLTDENATMISKLGSVCSLSSRCASSISVCIELWRTMRVRIIRMKTLINGGTSSRCRCRLRLKNCCSSRFLSNSPSLSSQAVVFLSSKLDSSILSTILIPSSLL